MLSIYSSRYNDQVQAAIFQMARADYEAGDQVYILVPEQYTLENEIKLMEYIDRKAVSRIRIMSFQRLALDTLAKKGGLKRTYIDNLGKSMLLKNILYKEELSVYASSVDKEGFVQSLLRQIAEFKRALIGPEDLLLLADKLEAGGGLGDKLRELAYIYGELDKVLANKYVDNEDRLGQLSEIEDMSHLAGCKVYIYAFLDFTAVEEKVIENLLRSGVEVKIGLCLDEESAQKQDEDVFSTSLRTKWQLEGMAREAGLKSLHYLLGQEARNQRPELTFLADNLFRTIPSLYEGGAEGLSIYAAHSIDEELHYIARDIVNKIRAGGYRYRDFMLVSSQEEAYNPMAKQIFSQYQIPLFIDEKRPIINSPIIKSLLALLKLLGQDLRLEDMMVFLKAGFHDLEAYKIYNFENYMLRRRFRGTMFLEDKYFQNKLELTEEEEREYELAMEVRAYLISCLGEDLQRFQGQQRARDFSKMLLEILERMEMIPKIQAFITNLRERNLLDEANENNQVWNIVLRILDQASEVFDDEEMDIGRFRKLFEEAVKAHELAVIPPSLDQVIMGNLDRSRAGTRRVVYLCGADATSLGSVYKEGAILTQEEKLDLAEAGVSLASEKDRVLANNQLTLYILLNSAQEELGLSYASEGGRAPAIILDQVGEIFPSLKVLGPRDLEPRDLISRTRPTLTILSRELKKFKEGQEIDPLWLTLLAYYLEAEESQAMARIALSAIEYKNDKEAIRDAKSLYRNRLRMSTTRLTSFAQCPFKHFIRYGLRARERKEYAIESAEVGIVLHETMELFIEHLLKEAVPLKELTRQETDRMVDLYFDSASNRVLDQQHINDSRNRFLLERQRETARHIAYLSVEQMNSGQFDLYKQELSFGYPETALPMELEVGEEKVQLIGTIDRIDILRQEGKTYVKIIDYKTRDKEFNLSDAYNGIDIQLLLYLYVALEAMEDPAAEVLPAGAFYFPVINPMLATSERDKDKIDARREDQVRADGIVISDEEILEKIGKIRKRRDGRNLFHLEEIRALIDHILEDLRGNIARMLEGDIRAYPTRQKDGSQERIACTYCRYASICRFELALGDQYRPLFTYKDQVIKDRLNQNLKGKEIRHEDQVDR